MLIGFPCPYCNAKLEVEAKEAGSTVPCPACNKPVIIPRKTLGVGSTIGDFKLKKLIGAGGMGQVYLARQLSMDREVAVKILPAQFTMDKELVDRFLREVRLAARLEHPNIVTAYAAGEDDGVYYMAMAYVTGETLHDRVEREGALPEKEALLLARKIASALAFAWEEHQLLHRDVKPENIILNRQGEPKLLDMGLSKTMDEAVHLSAAATILGTPNFASPEQIDGSATVDFRADIYSLGATLYHMLTGKIPFHASTVTETLHKQANEPLADPRDFNPTVSAHCVELMVFMLTRDPRHRHPSWAALVADIDRVLAGKKPARKSLVPGESVLLSIDAAKASVDSDKVRVARSQLHELHDTLSKRRTRHAPLVALLKVLGGLAGVAVLLGLAYRFGLQAEPDRQDAVTEEVAESPPDDGRPLAAPAAPAPDAVAPPEPAPPPEEPAVAAKAPVKTAPRVEETGAPVTEDTEHPLPPEPRADPAVAMLDALYADVAARLLDMEFDEAAQLVADAGREPALATQLDALHDLRTLVAAMAALPTAIINSYTNDIGTEIVVRLEKGPEKLQITSVGPRQVQARKMLRSEGRTVGSSSHPFTLSQLSVREIVARLGGKESAERDLLRGLLAHNVQNDELAGRYFLRSDTRLGETLLGQLDDLRLETAVAGETAASSHGEESDATRALHDLLDVAHFTTLAEDVDALNLAIRERNFAPVEVSATRDKLQAFLEEHGRSEVAEEYRHTLDLLAYVTPGVPLYAEASDVEQLLQRLEEANPRGERLVASYNIRDRGVELDLSGNRSLQELAPLAEQPIVSLNLRNTRVRDLAPLRETPLKQLTIDGCPVDSLRSLAGLRLTYLSMELCREIESLQPLSGMPLIELNLAQTRIIDLRPLQGLPLQVLDMRSIDAFGPSMTRADPEANRDKVLAPLADMTTLEHLDAEPHLLWRLATGKTVTKALVEGDFEKAIRAVEDAVMEYGDVPALQPTVARLQAMLDRHIPALKQLEREPDRIPTSATEAGGHHYLLCVLPMTWDEAAEYCEARGGHLATITSEQEARILRDEQVGGDLWAWLGGRQAGKDVWRWITGEPWLYSNWDQDWLLQEHQGHHAWLMMAPNGAWRTAGAIRQPCIIEWDRPAGVSGPTRVIPARRPPPQALGAASSAGL